MFESSRYRHRMATTATPRTYGAKNTARKRFRPGNFRFITRAIISGTTRSSGTLKTVKMPVARIDCQNAENVIEPGVNRWVKFPGPTKGLLGRGKSYR